MAKLVLTSEVMIQVSFLVMNLEHLLSQAVLSWLFSWWQSWMFSGKTLLVVQGNTMHADFHDRRACGVESRVARIFLVAT